MFHYLTYKLAGGVGGPERTRSQIATQGHKCRTCDLWYKGVKKKKRRKNNTLMGEKIKLLKGCTTEGVRNYSRKTSVWLDSAAVWNSLTFGRFPPDNYRYLDSGNKGFPSGYPVKTADFFSFRTVSALQTFSKMFSVPFSGIVSIFFLYFAP